ncbi:MAG: hypothetical protein Q4C67_04435 [Deinococcus sp.]|nr:hypothetical protein [Deinococcus sp.]
MTPLLGILVAALLLLGLLLVARAWQVRGGLAPETARKLMHLGMGLMALSFPWLLRETWAVLVVCALSVGALLGLRRVRALRQRVGGVLHDVERHSGGDVYFLLSVAGLYVLAQGDPVLYVIPLAVLTFADGLAALAGVNYGRIRYAGADGFKSVEGSVAFAAVTFLVTHVPLLLLSDVGRAESLAIAALVAVLTMLIEAIAWEGIDNVLVPLATFIAVDGHREATLRLQLEHLASITLLTVLVFVLRRRMPLTAGALASTALGLYLCLTLGSPAWLLAPVTVAAAALALYWARRPAAPRPLADYGVQVIVSLAIPGLMWLLTVRGLGEERALYGFTVCWAAQLAGLGAFSRQSGELEAPMHPASGRDLLTGLGLSLLVLLPWALLHGASAAQVLTGTALVAGALLLCGLLSARHLLNLPRQIVLLGLTGVFTLLVWP